MFELTNEQINEIINSYGGSKDVIRKIEQKVNIINTYLQFLFDQLDYLEFVISIVSQYESVKLKMEFIKKEDMASVYMNIDQIIELELTRKLKEMGIDEDCQFKK